MRPQHMTTLAALIGAIITVGVYGCKKQELQKEDTLPKQSVSLEERLYKRSKIAFVSTRDGNPEIYVMNADGSEQKRLTNNRAKDRHPSWSPFFPSENTRDRSRKDK